MSMTVHTAIKGLTDLELLTAALEEMKLPVRKGDHEVRRRTVLASAKISGRWVGFRRNTDGGLEMVGDSDWRVMNDTAFQNKLRQYYGVAAVRKKAEAMRYTVSSVETTAEGDIKIICRAWG